MQILANFTNIGWAYMYKNATDMGNINPQYTFDNRGNPIGVFLPIEDWNTISDELKLELPQWQKNLIDSRLALYNQNPTDTLPWEEILIQFDKEDECL